MGESVTFNDADRPVVLLIDAHPDVLHSLMQLLRLEPFELHSATCAADALALLASQPIDLVMSAARLPDMDGASLLAHIHQHYPHTVRI
ncbi:response regulator, partial [Pseudomonas salomonii]